MKKFKFTQAVRIGKNISDIFKLRCVSFISKNPPICGPHFHLYPGLMWNYKEDLSHRHVAHEGDWLCEDEEGLWHILSDDEYQKDYGNDVNQE